jgi:hypothetical protein
MRVTKLDWTDPPLGQVPAPARPIEIALGLGSGLARREGDPPGRFWAVGDRGPNLDIKDAVERYGFDVGAHAGADAAKLMPRLDIGPALHELQVEGDAVRLLRSLPLRGASGRPLPGLPVPGGDHAKGEPAVDVDGNRLEPDPSGVDSEGVIATGDGFWVGDEYGPSLLRLDAEGRVLFRWVPQGCEDRFEGADHPVLACLPAIAAKRRLNRGFEALALSADERRLTLAFQSPLAWPDVEAHARARHIRVWTIDAGSGAILAQHLYALDDPATFARDGAEEPVERKDLKISEIAALGDGKLLVLERASETTKLYLVAPADAQPLGLEHLDLATRPTIEELSAEGAGLPTLAKTLVLSTDDHPEIGPDLEGMVLLSPTELLLVSDNDFGVEGARTGFWRVELNGVLGGERAG